MHTYYTPVQESEHMAYAGEIAEYYGICADTSIANPYSRLIKIIIEDYMITNNIDEKPLFYPGQYLNRVYPRRILKPALEQFLSKTKNNKGMYESLSGKKYNYKIVH